MERSNSPVVAAAESLPRECNTQLVGPPRDSIGDANGEHRTLVNVVYVACDVQMVDNAFAKFGSCVLSEESAHNNNLRVRSAATPLSCMEPLWREFIKRQCPDGGTLRVCSTDEDDEESFATQVLREARQQYQREMSPDGKWRPGVPNEYTSNVDYRERLDYVISEFLQDEADDPPLVKGMARAITARDSRTTAALCSRRTFDKFVQVVVEERVFREVV